MTHECVDTIKEAYKAGRLNSYMFERLVSAIKSGVDKQLVDELISDAQSASDAGINNDREYTIYFFIGKLADDILDDTFGMKILPEQKRDLRNYILSHKNDKDYTLDNLTDYRLLTHKWLCDKVSKRAYPNTEGKTNRETAYNLDKWIGALKKIYAILHSKKADKQEAVQLCTGSWDLDEQRSFVNWMRYYEDGNTEKYNVKTAKFIKQAFEQELPLPQEWFNREDRANDSMLLSTMRGEKTEKTKREQELEKARQFKSQMRARLRSFKRLLEKYNDILPKQDLNLVYDELYTLEKSVGKLDVYASLQDCVIRSANRLASFGFSEGAEFLHKCAAEKISGKDVMESLPAPMPKEPDMPSQGLQTVNLQSVINRLEGTSKALKSRDMIRELASIDILLNELGLASYFPELSFAQSKLIEAFGYASNKVEDIVAKLRGGTKPNPAAPVAPTVPQSKPMEPKPIDTEKLLEKPVTEIKEKLPTR